MQPLTVRALSALAIGLFFAGCSGNGSTAIAQSGTVPDSLTHLTRSAGPDVGPEYLYVTNAGSNNVSIFSIGSLGVLTAVGSPVTVGSGPRGLAVGTDSNHNSSLYVANNGSDTVSAFHITAATGALTQIPTSPFLAHGMTPNGVASIGKCVFTTNSGSGTVSAFYIKGSPNYGALMWKANYLAGSHPENIAIDAASPFNPFVYVTNETSNTVTAYKALPVYPCTLTPVAGSPFAAHGAGPFGVAVDPTGSYVVVANLSSSNVSFFSIGGGGALTWLATITAGGIHPVGVAISGTYAFVPNESSDTVSTYTVAGTASGSPVTTDSYPQGVAVDPLGLYAYVANESTNDVSGYSIASGVLTATSPATFAAGTNPEYLATCKKVGHSCKPPPL